MNPSSQMSTNQLDAEQIGIKYAISAIYLSMYNMPCDIFDYMVADPPAEFTAWLATALRVEDEPDPVDLAFEIFRMHLGGRYASKEHLYEANRKKLNAEWACCKPRCELYKYRYERLYPIHEKFSEWEATWDDEMRKFVDMWYGLVQRGQLGWVTPHIWHPVVLIAYCGPDTSFYRFANDFCEYWHKDDPPISKRFDITLTAWSDESE